MRVVGCVCYHRPLRVSMRSRVVVRGSWEVSWDVGGGSVGLPRGLEAGVMGGGDIEHG